MTINDQALRQPDWLAGEMPPGYRNRLEEMQRLSRDLEEMGRFGRLLYAVGDDLAQAVLAAFVSLGFDAAAGSGGGSAIEVALGESRRLLIHVSPASGVIDRRGPDLAHVFQELHERAGDFDRVVLVSNNDPGSRPADRPEGITADALSLLKRLGANHLPAPALFAMWSLSLQNRELARPLIERLHEQDGGAFLLPALAGV